MPFALFSLEMLRMVTRVPGVRKPPRRLVDGSAPNPEAGVAGPHRGPPASALLIAAVFALGALSPAFGAESQRLDKQLLALSRDAGFTISGAEKLQRTKLPVKDLPLRARIKQLLYGYDHVLVHAAGGDIERVIILGPKRAAPPATEEDDSGEESVIKTRRQGQHHLVSLRLKGPSGATRDAELMIDTGASMVVLPESTGTELGFNVESLEQRELQTAKGKLNARIGQLPLVELGNERVQNVEVALVPDANLGGNALLGMNVLGRYLFILDDENNELTLIPEAEEAAEP
jgi:clan AA aspartic protease (TIGR02281 family)